MLLVNLKKLTAKKPVTTLWRAESMPELRVRAHDGRGGSTGDMLPPRDQRVTLSHEAYIPHWGIASEAHQKYPLTRAFLWR
jgi:hypothetical protein